MTMGSRTFSRAQRIALAISPYRFGLCSPVSGRTANWNLRITSHYTRCLRCAGAPKRRASGSGLSLLIPSWHAVLSDPGEFDIDIQNIRCRHWPSPIDHRLSTPDTPAIRFTRAVDFVASLVRFRYSLPGCSPPCTDQTGTPSLRGLLLPGFQRIGLPPRCWI